jgi:MoaA/NifB/PqqE/SkfB family radical SAM enzyme
LAKVFTTLLSLKEESEYVYITKKTLKALKELAATGKRTWNCRALDSFLVVDHLGRVAGCHSREPVASIIDLPKVWKDARFEGFRREYRQCTKCSYLCYVFYSLHSGLSGAVEVLRDQWTTAKILLREEQENNQVGP